MVTNYTLIKYILLFAGALIHIASNELHMLHKTHLTYHLDDVSHGTLAGSDFFCFAYVVAIALHLVHDAYTFQATYRYVIGIMLVIIPILSVVSYGQYVGWYYYEAPLSVIAAVCVLVASIMLLYGGGAEGRQQRRRFVGQVNV